MSEFKNLHYDVNDNIAVITLDHPPVNSLNTETFYELERLLMEISRRDDVRVVVITGNGKAFVAGADIPEMQELDGVQSRAFSQLGQHVFSMLEHLEQPVIAAVNGFALGGGCELTLACDLRIASEKAKFGQPEVNLGVIPGFGGTQRLPRLIGVAKAKELLYTGDMVNAATAEKIGLVNQVVPPEELMDTVMELAKKLCSRGPVALRLLKTVVNKGADASLETACGYESDAFGICFSSGEPKEGMTVFLETKKNKDWSK